MENKETQVINLVLDLENIIMDIEGFKGMLLALEEALFQACNWDKENYRYLVSHMYTFIYDINNNLKDTFNGLNGLKEKATNINDSDQANS